MLRSIFHRPFFLFLVFLLSTLPVSAQQSGDSSHSNPGRNADGAATRAADDKPRSVGSPYVELDSWIYPGIERLAALGYIHDEFLGMRPWTRVECARLVQEAGDSIDSSGSVPSQASQLQIELKKEFRVELNALAGGKDRMIRLESVYANLVGINGTPLNDSWREN
jgi:hypothetical protein